jgi:vacuolar-type H+-ATPase subunit D/Vma8
MGMVEPENIVLAHLRELRAELAQFREEVRSEFKRQDARLDAMHRNGEKALRGFIGHRAMVERTMASFEDEIATLKRRVERLETAQA